MNAVWGVDFRPGTPWWRVVLAKLVPFAVVAVGAAGLIAAVAARSVLRSAVEAGIAPETWLATGRAFPPFVLLGVFVIVAFVFRVLPDVRIAWRDVWLGSAVTSLLVVGATWALQVYLTQSGATSVFGAAGSFVAVMLWVYLVAQIVLLGAEFTEAQAEMRGAPIVPASYAVSVRRVLEVEEGPRDREPMDAPDPVHDPDPYV
jgi:membrane protein